LGRDFLKRAGLWTEPGEDSRARWQSEARPVLRAGKNGTLRMPFNLEEAMKRLMVSLVSAAGLLVPAAQIRGQDLLVPAGTLLHSGTEGSVDEAQVNWRKTTELTSDMRSADRPMLARQTN
jgi:hypothetical protein